MSYQIKSTPYFKRMLTKSKQNGQLQMLKEEYERLSTFNERKIEMRMREVRLNRLKREVEKTLKFNSKRRRLNPDIQKTNRDDRIENFKRARNLGQHFSRLNFRRPKFSTNAEDKPRLLEKEMDSAESYVLKRIEYGNTISKRNMEKIDKIRKRRNESKSRNQPKANNNSDMKSQQRKESDLQTQQKSMSLLRDKGSTIDRTFGSTSIKNSRFPSVKQMIDFQIDSANNSSVLSLSENVRFIDLESADIPLFENYEKMHEASLRRECLKRKHTEENKPENIWHQIATNVGKHLPDLKGNNSDAQDNIQSSSLYEPFPVENGTGSILVKCDSIAERLDQINRERNEIYKKGWSGEYLFKTDDPEVSGFSSSLQNSILTKIDVDPAIRPFPGYRPIEPIARDAKQEETHNFSVGKLRTFFEIQNK